MRKCARCLVGVLVLGAVCAGCVVAPQTPTATAYSRMYAGQNPVRLLNAASRPVCYVHIAPAGQADWGDDWLAANETVPTGMMRQLGVVPGVYNVRLDDCSQTPMQLQMGLDLTGPRDIVLYDGGAPPAIPSSPGVGRIDLVAMAAPPPSAGWSASAPAGGGGYGDDDGSGYESSAPPAIASDAPAPSASSGPATYSLTLHNSCDHSLGLFHGTGSGRPPFASGTYGSIGSNTTESFSGFAPETFWIVDDSRNAISSYTASGGSQRIEIMSSCSGFGAY